MLASLRRDRRGGTAVLLALGLPVLLGMAALAVDLGAAELAARRLQGLADSAAMAAAADPANGRQGAQAVIGAAHWPGPVTLSLTAGDYSADAALPADRRFTPDPASGEAVRVTLAAPTPTYFARLFGQSSIPITRTATAAQQRYASFSIGSRLASVNGGLLNAYLSALTGSSISLSVADYNGLVGADVDLLGFLDALKTNVHLEGLTYQQVLDTQITSNQALLAAAGTVVDTTTANALRTIANASGGRPIRIGSLVDLGIHGNQTSNSALGVKLNAMSLATAMLELASPDRQVSFDAGLGVPGIAGTHITIAIGERPNQSPWVAITDNGQPIVRTAQARVYVETTLSSTSLPGLSGLVAIRLPIFLELASAESRLSGISCGTIDTRGVTLEARPSPGELAIASLDPGRLDDFTTPMALSSAKLVHALLADVYGYAVIDLGAAEPWQSLWFSADDIAGARARTISSSTLVQSITASLIGRLQLTVSLLGLPIPLSPLTAAIGSVLQGVAPALDGLLNVVTGALGVHLGEADVRVTGMRCGVPALVA